MTVIENTITWSDVFAEEKKLPYFQNILQYINHAKQQNITVYPNHTQIFHAFKITELYTVRVVILGQDPYHGPNQAHGLAFSVPDHIPKPPSLRNIFKELEHDLGIPSPKHGNLTHWAKQGVFLLNSVLTVEAHKAHSHANIGWEHFTDKVIAAINSHCDNVVFLLWGAHAQKKCGHIDHNKHCILRAPHPSPLSAHRGFLGCKHFSMANTYLKNHGKKDINWQLT